MDFIPKYTSFGVVDKRAQQMLTHTEFNEYINQLAEQGNHNARAIVELNGEMIAFEILLKEIGGTNLEVIEARTDGVNQIQYATIGARMDSLRQDIRSVGIRFEEGYSQIMGSFDEKLGDYITKAEYSSSIQQSATQILLEVDKKIQINSQNYYTKQESNSQISQKAEEILLQVNEKIEEVNNFNPDNYYTKTETTSQIKQQAGEIALTVSQKEIKGVKVGAANLIVKSNERKQLDRPASNFNEISYPLVNMYHDLVLTEDTTFVLSFLVDRIANTENECFDTITFDNGWNHRWSRADVDQIIRVKDQTYKFIMKPKTIPSGVSIASKISFLAEFQYGGGIFYNIMLTEGNKIVDWSLASEELATVTEMNSAIIQKANEITTSVSQTYATKGEVSGNYATKSELTQTATDFTFKLQHSGGYNLVRNGNALNGQNHWAAYWLPSASWNIRNDEWSGYVPCLQIVNASGANQENTIFQNVNTVVGKTYTASALVAGHRAINYITVVNGGGTTVISISDMAEDMSGGSDISGWKRISTTFVATEQTMQIRLCNKPQNGTVSNHGWFKEIQVEEGHVVTNYSPSPDEVYTGVTTIDNQGVTVTHSEDSSYTSLSARGVEFFSHGSGHRYHNLMKQGWVDTISFGGLGAGGWGLTVELPPEFRNKPFSVIPILSYVGCPHIGDALKAFEINVPHSEVNYAAGTFRLYVYTSGLWIEGLSVTYSLEMRCTWIAIA